MLKIETQPKIPDPYSQHKPDNPKPAKPASYYPTFPVASHQADKARAAVKPESAGRISNYYRA